MSKEDIQKKNERERDEWRTRSVAGMVIAVNPAAREIILQTRGAEGASRITLTAAEDISLLRYAPDSVNFGDAKPSSFGEIVVGDQVRALGQRSSDGSRFTAEKIVSGSFRTIGGVITDISRDTNEVKVNIFGGKEALIVVLKKASILRKVLPQAVPVMIQIGLAEAAAARAPQAAKPAPPAANSQPTVQQSGPASGSAPRPNTNLGLQDIVERLPTIDIAELKRGDVIAVSGTIGSDRSRMTAITILTGVDLLINAMQRPAAGRSQPVVMGLPPGFSDIGIGRP